MARLAAVSLADFNLVNHPPVSQREAHRVPIERLERGEQLRAVVPVLRLGFQPYIKRREAGLRRAKDRTPPFRRQKGHLDRRTGSQWSVGKR